MFQLLSFEASETKTSIYERRGLQPFFQRKSQPHFRENPALSRRRWEEKGKERQCGAATLPLH